jgi:putative acetyltransferase
MSGIFESVSNRRRLERVRRRRLDDADLRSSRALVTLRIRYEVEADGPAIRAVNEAAFASSAEADLVEALRGSAVPLVSLVADSDGKIVGHILFSPVVLIGHDRLRLTGLGPMAVAPDHQRKGIGSELVREGLSQCRQLGYQGVVVLGHPQYYPRFGFVAAERYGIRSEYDVPADAFMIAELEPRALRNSAGVIRYDEAFAGV